MKKKEVEGSKKVREPLKLFLDDSRIYELMRNIYTHTMQQVLYTAVQNVGVRKTFFLKK